MSATTNILELLHARGLGNARFSRVMEQFRAEGGTVRDFAEASPVDLVRSAGLGPQFVQLMNG